MATPLAMQSVGNVRHETTRGPSVVDPCHRDLLHPLLHTIPPVWPVVDRNKVIFSDEKHTLQDVLEKSIMNPVFSRSFGKLTR